MSETREITQAMRQIYDDVKPMLRDAYLAFALVIAVPGVLDQFL